MTLVAAESENQFAMRGTLTRIGITLLNIVQPGLGLLRLGKLRSALGYISLQLLGAGLLWLGYSVTPTLTYATWLSILSVGVVVILVLYGGSMAMTWRSSRRVEPRTGWLWRWYGVIAVCVGVIAVTSPLSGIPLKYYRNFWVPADSMYPTLQVGDRFVAKMQGFPPLRRGDVVVVRKGTTEYVKRIVALPGDKITMIAGQIILNGKKIVQHEVAKTLLEGVDSRPATVLVEQLPGEARPHQVIDIMMSPQDDWTGVLLRQDEFVLLGDNRDNSLDSRFPEASGGLGIVPRARIEGRALFRYWRRGSGLGEGAI